MTVESGVAGLLLAAGAGRRYGKPKALVDTGHGPWLVTSLATLSGFDHRLVVLGAAAGEAAALVPPGVHRVVNPDWSSGMGGSLALGLRELVPQADVHAALIMLVDLPDVTAAVVARVAREASSNPATALARAAYGGRSGHPVLVGRHHWAGMIAASGADVAGRGYLATQRVSLIECGDLATGHDVDQPESPAG